MFCYFLGVIWGNGRLSQIYYMIKDQRGKLAWSEDWQVQRFN